MNETCGHVCQGPKTYHSSMATPEARVTGKHIYEHIGKSAPFPPHFKHLGKAQGIGWN